ncbi:MAG: hypothetical protein ACLP2X_08150 [Syntrophobacteraceae bacterium]
MAKVKWGWTFALILFLIFAALTVFAEQQATRIIKFAPTTHVRDVRAGKCWTSSIAAPRPDAWRCMIENEIFDPCFASTDRNLVICNPNPPKGYPGFRLRLTEPLPRSEIPAQSVYEGGWLVELADGTLCRPATGARFEVKGKVATYYCDSWQKGKDIVLLDGLNTGTPLWMAEKATIVQGPRGPNYLSSHKIAVKTVWQ